MEDNLIEVEDQVLELDNGKKYVIVDTISYENIKYYYTVGYLEDGYNVDDYQFFKIDGEFVEEVTDDNLIKMLIGCVIADNINDHPELYESLEKAAKLIEESKKDRE